MRSVPSTPRASSALSKRLDPTRCDDASDSVRTVYRPSDTADPADAVTVSASEDSADFARKAVAFDRRLAANSTPTTLTVNSVSAAVCALNPSVRATKRSRGRPLIAIN